MLALQKSLQIVDLSNVGEARRLSSEVAGTDSSESWRGKLAIIISELTRNMILHAGGGELILEPWKQGQAEGIDILALDKGPGIADMAKCMQDGYSSAGTPGTGMGAVTRLSDAFEIFSQPGKGTAIFSRLASNKSQLDRELICTGAVSIPMRGETECGDAWAIRDDRDRRMLVVADGLGHGGAAAEAAEEAILTFNQNSQKSPTEILAIAHQRLQKTRGAAVAIAELNFRSQTVHYAGVGNIAGSVVENGFCRNMVSMNGIVGHQSEHIKEFVYPWKPGALLLMHSDGLSTRASLNSYSGLAAKHPALIAGVVYRDFRRERDDATVVVSRE